MHSHQHFLDEGQATKSIALALSLAPQRHDVISSVDGLCISNDGRVRRDGMSPLDFRVVFSLKLVGESISLVMCAALFFPLRTSW